MKNSLSLALGAALALLTLEGVSRWYYSYSSIQDPVLGSIVPGGHTVRSRIEGAGVAHFEANGVRRSPRLGSRKGNQILCLGDSFTEAFQVTDEALYTTKLEESLTRAGMTSVVLNVARSGWSVADYIANARQLRTSFAPDWTVIQVQDVDFEKDAWDAAKTHFSRPCAHCPLKINRVDPQPDSALRSQMRKLRNRSALVAFLGYSKARFLLASRRPRRATQAEESAPVGEPAADKYAVREQLRMLADAYEGRLTLLVLGCFDAQHPTRDSQGEVLIKRAARELGISIARSKDRYAFLAAQGTAPYGFGNTALNTGHMNAAGHAVAADVLAREILMLRARRKL